MKGFLLDLHCHTQEHSPDAGVPAARIVASLMQKGFSGVVFTDHNYVWPEDELRGLAWSAGAGDDFLLLSGQEVRTYSQGILRGDLLVFGLSECVADGISPEELFLRAKSAGGFLIAPHPSAPGIGFGEHLNSIPLAAVETWNGRYGPRLAKSSRLLAGKHGLPEAGGSDTHQALDIGGGGTLFHELPRNLRDIHLSLLERQCRPWRPSWLSRTLG